MSPFGQSRTIVSARHALIAPDGHVPSTFPGWANATAFVMLSPGIGADLTQMLVTFGARRSRRWPQVPTLIDLGFDMVAQSPYGLAGPRGLPSSVVAVLHAAFKTAMFDPLFIRELDKYDQDVEYLGPADYAQSCREFYARERTAAEKMGLLRSTS